METSFDPLLFWPSTVIDLIFQHLNGREVLNAALVSKSWSSFVENSSQCMKIINLVIIGRKYFVNNRIDNLKDELTMLTKSKRRYENFTLFAQSPGFLTNQIVDLLSTNRGKWKSIKVWSEKFSNATQLENFFLSFSESVENLELRNISFTKPLIISKEIEMKKLKSLSLCNVKHVDLFLKSFRGCDRLQFLEIENDWDERMISFLSEHSKVSDLTLSDSNLNDKFLTDLSQLQTLKLENLKLKFNARCCSSQNGLIRFLRSQQKNLRNLTLDGTAGVIPQEVFETIFKLPHLRIFKFFGPLDYQLIGLPTNLAIEDFKLMFTCKEEFFEPLIESMPNVKALSMCSLKDTTETALRSKLPNLKTLFVHK